MRQQVVARIQAHPARVSLHAPLAESLGIPSEVVLHSSEPPSPWDGYRACLRDLPECSHLLIIQDDAQVARGFAPALQLIAARNPDTPAVLFLGGFPQGTASKARKAMLVGQRYVSLHLSPIVPMVAVLWPMRKAQEFLSWAESGVTLMGHPTPRADDGIAAQWMKATRQEILVTVPSIVQHPDVERSVKGGPQDAAAGKDALRVAALFCEDASIYDWS